LAGKVAVITGAAGGIGSATARLMTAEGARVVLADVNLPAAEAVSREIAKAGGEGFAVHLDLADEASIVALFEQTLSRFGRVDVLHNNAADLSPELYPMDRDIESMTAAVWDRTFTVNTRGTMLCCREALVKMRAAGGGAIINTASNLALQGSLIQAAYAASKAAIIQMTRSIATSHGKYGIRCNTVSPGLTLSDAAASTIPKEIREMVEADTLTPYLGKPNDIGHLVVFLASDEARYITGQNFVADGGTAAHMPSYSAMRAREAAADKPAATRA
jgi:NAD(P)-dependent dehydrogenase (short-subunit alcohol dehydrogenase family)